MISDDAADGLIATAINDGDLQDFSEDAVGGLITTIDARDYMDSSGLLISDDATDGLIATAVDSTEFSDTNV